MAVVRNIDEGMLGVETADDIEDVVETLEAVDETYAGKDVVVFVVTGTEEEIDTDELM